MGKGGAARRLHDMLRITYLLISASSLPLSVLYLKINYREHISGISFLMGICLIMGGIFWTLFFVVFGQRYFPFTLKRALLVMGGIMSNAVVAANLGGIDVLYGAYSVMLASVTSQVIFFCSMTFLFIMPGMREKYYFYTQDVYVLVPLSAGAFTGFLLWYLHGAAVNEFLSESSIFWRGLYLLVLILDVTQYLRGYFKRNMFVYDKPGMREVRDDVLTDWGPPIVLAAVGSVMAAILAGALV